MVISVGSVMDASPGNSLLQCIATLAKVYDTSPVMGKPRSLKQCPQDFRNNPGPLWLSQGGSVFPTMRGKAIF
jgi:hypothetical protein